MITTLPIIEESQNRYIEDLKKFSQEKFEKYFIIKQFKKKKGMLYIIQKESFLYMNPDPGKYSPDYKYINKQIIYNIDQYHL